MQGFDKIDFAPNAVEPASPSADGLETATLPPEQPNEDVLAHLRGDASKKGKWINTLVILGLSVAAFMAVGLFQWREALWLLLPVLAFHEVGHLVAMRLFGYRNLKMFFIPFFGAAVTGHNQNVAGWKKAVVALAGPLPGIALGIPLGIAGIATGHEWLVKAAMMLLILNGFNLLPLLPLDGGWVLHAVLFSRHPLLDVGFRGLAIVCLVGLGLAAGDRVMMFVAIPLAIGLPTAYRSARIAAEIRREHPEAKEFRGPIEDSPVIQPIIERVRAVFGRGITSKLTADVSRNVLELATARPPGLLASIGLLFTHGAAVLVTLVFAVVFIVGRHGNLGEIVEAAATQPAHRLDTSSMAMQGGDDLPDVRRETLTATWDDEAQARAAFQQQADKLPAGARLTLFGNSVLLSAPVGNRLLLQQTMEPWRGSGAAIGHEWGDDSFVYVTLQCTAPNAKRAEAMTEELNDMLAVAASGFATHPPWSSHWNDDNHSYDDARKSWNTYRRLTQPSTYPDHVKRLAKAQALINQPARRLGKVQVDEFVKYSQELARIDEEKHERLRQEGADQVDTAVIDVYDRMLKQQTTPDNGTDEADSVAAHAELLEEQAATLKASLIDFANDPQTPADSIRSGRASQTALYVRCDGLRFAQIDVGLPALARWLVEQGCVDLRYQFDSYEPFDPNGDEGAADN